MGRLKLLRRILVASVVISTVGACDTPEQEAAPTGVQPEPAASRASSDLDLFVDKVDIVHATVFTVSYHGNYKVVRIAPAAQALQLSATEGDAWEAATVDTLVLFQRGTTPPELDASLASATVIEVPIRSAAVNRDADAIRIKDLGFADRLIGIGGTGIFDPDLRSRVEAGTLPAIGSALHRSMDLELLLKTAPEAIFLRVASLDHTYEFKRLRDLGLASVPVYTWAETNGLARAEWLKYVALFFNAEAEANRQFDAIEARYNELLELASSAPLSPTAVWAYSPRAGGWRVHRHGVEAGFLADAGIHNVMVSDNAAVSAGTVGHSEGLPISDERFLRDARGADLWITWSPTSENWPSSRFLDNMQAYRDNNVYHHRKRRIPETGADDWYETGQLRPDLILADLIAVAYDDLLPGHDPVFFERLNINPRED